MKNINRVNDIKFEELDRDEYTFDDIADMLGTSRGRVYYNINKYNIPSRRVRGKMFFSKDSVIYLMKCVNRYIDNTIFHKRSRLYPSRRRRGNYKDFYRADEVMFALRISEAELNTLVEEGKLQFTSFSKNGVKRGGYAIEIVDKLAVQMGKTVDV